jgi:hypothetical protein
MVHALRLSYFALASTALIFLASASVASAQTDTRAPEKASAAPVHRQAGPAGSTIKAHAAVRTVRQPSTHVVAGETSVRTSVHETTVRTSGGATVARSGHWIWRGGAQVWQSYGVVDGGYASGTVSTGAVYGGNSGATGHSCWWYRQYDPAGLPGGCPRYYGSSYGYSNGYSAPSSSYSYSQGYSAPGYRYGGVTRTVSTRVTSTRVADVSSARFTSHSHVAVTRPAETGAHMRTHAQAGAQVHASSAPDAKVRKQTP